MNEKILFLARKLKNFTLDDIAILTELPEPEIKSCLEKLLKEEIIQKTKSGYVLKIKENICQAVVLPKVKVQTPAPEKQPVKQICEVQNVQLDNVSEFNLETARKSLWQLELTKGLYGKQLKDFIDKYNSQNPENKISYSTIYKKRAGYSKYGMQGLIGKYGKTDGYRFSPTEYYELFKELYLSPQRRTFEQCMDEITRHFWVTREELPSKITYRRWMRREFTPQEIRERRGYVFS